MIGILIIGGSDCSCGAGIQGDLKTVTNLGAYGTTIITSIVAEHPGRVESLYPLPFSIIESQFHSILDFFPISAIKIGMLYKKELPEKIAEFIQKFRIKAPIVIDPVLAAGNGDPLAEPGMEEELPKNLFPLATIVTPNIEEAEILSGFIIEGPEDLPRVAQDLAEQYGTSFMIKGGHLQGKTTLDVLHHNGKTYSFELPRIFSANPHGTGCSMASMIAVFLAQGLEVPKAVERAKHTLYEKIKREIQIGPFYFLPPQ
ncbi:bifunctional hydroxymethylpyrimidine kinase/phosphomethylpyrimidine kinase [Methylacidiphilum sp. Yel]|jgi:hydroxymethylpyrimidine/phosphomethylpyrimidine kinase|uniref:bifunctional hydroxymethylpyrimidine kinase/phosphomethylpyrimidine kinase n=1 Tax=Methylacidiphilum sp. Yel TaxID=1847730 RepID=UPI00106D9033|nr:bifunctional hydroxymethylpyrimidine kinase/phosphomethylpyrimidine kinase [Methylacidiphilum sp. Yel]TFE71012.1 bifunctional hydroxymethylpyrimidine kinase/phosphomethylpyrimidine kinase [Methylacidiphilum sp. Yel]